MLLLAQAGTVGGLGQLLIYAVILGALWAIFAALVAPRLPAPAVLVINVVIGAIVAIVAIKVLLSFA